MGLRMVHYPNGRFQSIESHGTQIPSGHPNSLEPPQKCAQSDCDLCLGIEKCRIFVNACFVAQHQTNDDESVHGE